ncbi:glycosyltransferase family 4 protein [Deinococcus cellulosilyticus]|uniref:Mannosyltransferase n=1 Tax=Deinococcus cellulosilyticus (strain DSM 18568 / NBRC 106333 / KACC 11606 / 5516J-15) TaxID=1223518 RepID=A0A511MYA6_DEIC1|nr:glycosyltransferase family 1 protein [Deinococcus cellulosilyticus]GEM45268.1 mannosyltransferase [Deinococcus cellulosilyticus NBRC 106333 = KACC 11606]
MPESLVVNVRTLMQPLTGVQRYTQELLNRHPDLPRVAPTSGSEGFKGHLWEQFQLPGLVRGKLLWSPGNTGPLSVPHQVLTIHDLATLDHPEWFERKFALWYGFLLPRLASRVQHILTVSQHSRRQILRRFGLPEDRVTAIPLAADPRFRPCTPAEKEAYRQKKQLGRYVLAVGSLEPRKNLRLLFEAWMAWKDRPEDLELAVAGGAGKVFSSIGFPEIPPGVRLLGRVPDEDLPLLYAGAEVFVFPSLYEGFGLPPLEAMACGTPVITTEVTSLPEVVGEAGWYCDPHDAGSLVTALRALMEAPDRRQEMTQQGLVRAGRFSWDRTAQATWDVLLEHSRRNP